MGTKNDGRSTIAIAINYSARDFNAWVTIPSQRGDTKANAVNTPIRKDPSTIQREMPTQKLRESETHS
jgi:hypothetical protein